MGLTGCLEEWAKFALLHCGLISTAASAEDPLWMSRSQRPGCLASVSVEEFLQLIGSGNLLLAENQFIDAQFLYSRTSRMRTLRLGSCSTRPSAS